MKIKVEIESDGRALGVLDWLEKKSTKAFQRTIRAEAKFLSKEMKKEIRTGGNPKFAPISGFTRAIRRAQGRSSGKAGVSSGSVLKGIKSTQLEKLSFFSGVTVGSVAKVGRRDVDLFKASKALELGRGILVLDLDKPSSTTGKTPRQWLWWLYLNGVLKSPPNKAKTHLLLDGSPPRPFAGNVFAREEKNVEKRMFRMIEKIASAEVKNKKLK